MMRFWVFVCALFLLSNHAMAGCTSADLNGDWYVKYWLFKPPQVGECSVTLGKSRGPTGECRNLTYDLEGKIFDGDLIVQKNCRFKAFAIMSNGQSVVMKGRLRGAGYASGKIKAINAGRIAPGRFKMWRNQ